MKLLADECCDAPIVNALRAAGFDVAYAIEGVRGLDDAQLLNRAFDEGRILLTQDKDFGELVYRLRHPSHGIILLRFDPEHQLEMVDRVVGFLLAERSRLAGCFAVLDPERARIRSLAE